VPDPVHPEELVGRWVRVHPSASRRDTLTLGRDGSAEGESVLLVTNAGTEWRRANRWKVGTELMPGGLCIRDDAGYSCMGFLVRNDTLALANVDRRVYVRAEALGADDGMDDANAPGTPPDGIVPAAPAPFQPVSGIAPASR
jgi:hypothetical protein